jgi:hydrogenase maturation protease
VARVLIAGIGNALRGDDGFGPAVIRALQDTAGLDDARATDVGIGGVALVHELMDGYDAVIAVDCMRRGGTAGSVYVVEATVPDVEAIAENDRVAIATDMHDVGPDRALLIARAAGVLPPRVWLVGCEPADVDELRFELSPPVRAALPRAVEAIRALLREAAGDRVREPDGGY